MITVRVIHKGSEETSPVTKPHHLPHPSQHSSSVAHSGSDVRAGYKPQVVELIMGQNKNGKRRLAAQSHIK